MLLDTHRRMALASIRSATARVLEEHLIEILSPDLVGVGRAAAERAVEGEGVVAALVVRLEVGPALVDSEIAHLIGHAQPLEDGQAHRQERLADVKTWVMRLLEKGHLVAGAGEEGSRRAPGRSAADHCDVAGFNDFLHELSMHRRPRAIKAAAVRPLERRRSAAPPPSNPPPPGFCPRDSVSPARGVMPGRRRSAGSPAGR